MNLRLGTLAALLVAGVVNATPVYYTFSGTSYGQDLGFTSGQSVSFTVMADRSLDGYNLSYGNINHQADYPPYYDYFYDTYVGGDLPTVDLSAPANNDYHFGISDSRGLSLFYVSNKDISGYDVFSIRRDGISVDNLTVGTTFNGYYQMYDYNYYWGWGGWRGVSFDLTLSNISSTNPLDKPFTPVPEPGMLCLLGIGLGLLSLIGLMLANRSNTQNLAT